MLTSLSQSEESYKASVWMINWPKVATTQWLWSDSNPPPSICMARALPPTPPHRS